MLPPNVIARHTGRRSLDSRHQPHIEDPLTKRLTNLPTPAGSTAFAGQDDTRSACSTAPAGRDDTPWTGYSSLITRRSQVQILPPPLKALVDRKICQGFAVLTALLPGLQPGLYRTGGDCRGAAGHCECFEGRAAFECLRERVRMDWFTIPSSEHPLRQRRADGVRSGFAPGLPPRRTARVPVPGSILRSERGVLPRQSHFS